MNRRQPLREGDSSEPTRVLPRNQTPPASLSNSARTARQVPDPTKRNDWMKPGALSSLGRKDQVSQGLNQRFTSDQDDYESDLVGRQFDSDLGQIHGPDGVELHPGDPGYLDAKVDKWASSARAVRPRSPSDQDDHGVPEMPQTARPVPNPLRRYPRAQGGGGAQQMKTSSQRPNSKNDEGTGAGAMGGQPQTSDAYKEALKSAIRGMVREVVRKKEGGGGYVLYGPNKGKKKNPKPAGEFPTRFAAKRAELARFPPKDPKQLKAARTRMDKLNKDPKKRAEAERKDLTGRKPGKKSGAPARDRKKKTEEFIRMMTRDLQERLFQEDEVPGSPWDERMSSMHPDAIASDKKLSGLHRNIEKASIGALGDAHKGLHRVLRGIAKVNPGDIAHDPDRDKTFLPVMLDCDGHEVGPVHLYVDGGHVKIEVSKEARQQIAEMEPLDSKELRGGLSSFEEDHLPKIDQAKKAWNERDSYLDRIHGKLEKHLGNMSGVETHLAKALLGKRGR